jgi:Fe-S cluster assembly protein SufB
MTTIDERNPELEGIGRYEFGWSDSDAAGSIARRGLSEEVVADISSLKSEPQWMLDLRMKGLKLFHRKPMPTWGSDLGGIDFDNIKYFVRSSEKQAATWDDLPEDIKNTYDKLGIPESTTRSARTSRSRASSSSTPTPRCASTRTSSASTSAPSSRSATTSSPR